MKNVITKKIEVLKELLNIKQTEEKIDLPLKRSPLTPKGHRKGCRCHG